MANATNANSPATQRRAKTAHFIVGAVGISVAAWFFLRTESVFYADLYLFGFLALGEIGGRVAAYAVSRFGESRLQQELTF